MFNIGFPELIVVLLIAFLVVGPDDLPKVARAAAHALKWIRDIVRQFKEELEWDRIVREVNEAKGSIQEAVTDSGTVDEIHRIKEEMEEETRQLKEAVHLSQNVVQEEFLAAKEALEDSARQAAADLQEDRSYEIRNN